MLIKSIARIALPVTLALTAINVSAYAPSKTTFKTGVVESIDLEEKLISIAVKKTGEVKTYRFASNPKASLDGKKTTDLSVISPGQTVTLKLKALEPETI